MHVDHDHAKKQEDCRQTLANFFLLMLRDKVDVVSGDFNQSYHFIGEVLTEVVKIYEKKEKTHVIWAMPGQIDEIRTIMFNWPTETDPTFSGQTEMFEMMVKDVKKLSGFTVEQFGLKSTDQDSHIPSLFIVRKSRKLSHKDRHQQSEASKKRDAERRKKKQRDSKKRRLR